MAHIIELAPQTREKAVSQHEPWRVNSGEVFVIFTSTGDTLRAVRVARRLAREMRSGVTIVHFRSIGFGAPLEEPPGLSPIETDAFKAQLEAEAEQQHKRRKTADRGPSRRPGSRKDAV